MSNKEKIIYRYINDIYGILWSCGIDDSMYIVCIVSRFLYLKSLEDFDEDFLLNTIYHKDSDIEIPKRCNWEDLKSLDSYSFSENIEPYFNSMVIAGVHITYYNPKKRIDSLSTIYYHLFQLLDRMIFELRESYVDKEYRNEVFGDIFDGLLTQVESRRKAVVPSHIARLLCELVEVNATDDLAVPFANHGELIVEAYNKVIADNAPAIDEVTDDGFKIGHLSDAIFSVKHYREFSILGLEKDENARLLALLNCYFHQIPLRDRILKSDFSLSTHLDENRLGMFNSVVGILNVADSVGRDNSIRNVVAVLKEKGLAAVIVPDSYLFSSAERFKKNRKFLLENNYVDAVISLPKGVFASSTNIKTSILVLSKKRKLSDNFIWFCELLNDGYSLNSQRKRNMDYPMPELLGNYRKKEDVDTSLMYSINVPISKIMEKDSVLTVFYYKEKENKQVMEVNPVEVYKDIVELEEQIRKGLNDLSKIL